MAKAESPQFTAERILAELCRRDISQPDAVRMLEDIGSKHVLANTVTMALVDARISQSEAIKKLGY